MKFSLYTLGVPLNLYPSLAGPVPLTFPGVDCFSCAFLQGLSSKKSPPGCCPGCISVVSIQKVLVQLWEGWALFFGTMIQSCPMQDDGLWAGDAFGQQPWASANFTFG